MMRQDYLQDHLVMGQGGTGLDLKRVGLDQVLGKKVFPVKGSKELE